MVDTWALKGSPYHDFGVYVFTISYMEPLGQGSMSTSEDWALGPSPVPTQPSPADAPAALCGAAAKSSGAMALPVGAPGRAGVTRRTPKDYVRILPIMISGSHPRYRVSESECGIQMFMCSVGPPHQRFDCRRPNH